MFFDRFKNLCESRGVSIYKAATDIGLNRAAANKWKSGSVPRGKTLSLLANYFGVSNDYLLGEESEEAPSVSGERFISDDDLIFALWGDNKEITSEDLDDVRRYADFIGQRRKEKK